MTEEPRHAGPTERCVVCVLTCILQKFLFGKSADSVHDQDELNQAGKCTQRPRPRKFLFLTSRKAQ